MAFLGTQKLKDLLSSVKVVDPYDPNRVDCGAYQLSLGEEVFCTDSKDKKKAFLTKANEQVKINPGQFALLLTHETVHIPTDKIAFISIKAKIKLKGLVNVSGFHVDPGFKGKLLFSVYNAGTSPISLLKENPCFLIWFANLELSEQEQTSYANGNHTHKDQATILPEYMDHLSSGELASPNVLLEKINDNFKTLDEKAKTRDYLIKAALAIIIAIGLKCLADWGMYSKGVDDGYIKKGIEIRVDSTMNKLMKEKKTLIYEIDSLNKLKADTTKKK